MRTTHYHLDQVKKIIALFVVFFASFLNSFAGDVKVGRISLPSELALKGVPTPIEIILENKEAFPVTSLVLTFQIRNILNQILFNATYNNITVPANSSLKCSSYPSTWTPTLKGTYKLSVTSSSPVDINPTNNGAEMEFKVLDKPNVWVEQFNLFHPFRVTNSSIFSLGVDVPASDEVLWLNVLARKPMATAQYWVVQNMPLLPFHSDRKVYYPWYMPEMGYVQGEDVTKMDLSLSLSYKTQKEPFLTYSYDSYTVTDFDYNVAFDNIEKMTPGIVPEGSIKPGHNQNTKLSYTYRGCDVPNIDLDSSAYKPNEIYTGDWNACGPASAANSLEWLEKQHPGKLFSIFGHREKMTALSKFMNRENNKGVTTEQLAKGKLGFIDLADLPIHVKYQSWFVQDSVIKSPDATTKHVAHNMSDSIPKKKPPTWEFLKSEIEKGEDVEILFGWYDHGTVRHGGHWVTVTGVVETDTLKGIFIKDDGNQAVKGGTKETYLIWKQQGDWSRLVGYDGPNNYCWVESVVSESYDPTVTHSGTTGILELPAESNLNKTELHLNKNPIGIWEEAKINVSVGQNSDIQIEVYNYLGQLLHRQNLGIVNQGEHLYSLPSGIFRTAGQYLVVLKAPGIKASRKLLVIRD
jgi:hypothetical protein